MTRTCRNISFLILAVSTGIAFSQSLEDKVSQSRKLQAQSLLGAEDQLTVDSLIREKKRNPTKRRETGAADSGFFLDSLLSGPFNGEAADTAAADTLSKSSRDASKKVRKNTLSKSGQNSRLPMRFEQRIFRSVDRSAFSSARGVVGKDYVLGPGDEITVSLWGDKEKEYDLTLNPEGKIFLEGIGLVPLAGSNLNEAQAVLKAKLARIYSGIARGTSQVDVSLGKAGPMKVFVLGEVKVPGGYVLSGNSGILSAMYFAQGPTDIGTVRNLQLTRGGKKTILDLYQYLIYGQALHADALRDGDILFAARADALVEIKGDVGRPAIYELRKGEGVKELLEFSGKLNPTAASHRMTLQRIFPGGKIDYIDLATPQDYLSGKAVMELRDGDKIMVEKSTEPTRNFVTVSGPLNYPGTYSAEGLSNVADLIARAGGLREDAFLGRAHVVRFKPDGSSELFAYSLDSTQMTAISLQPRDNVILYSLKDMYIPDSVQVEGAVFNPGRYEFREGMTAKDLVMQAGGFLPQYEKGRMLVFRGEAHDRKVEQVILNIKEGLQTSNENFPLKPRDLVQVPRDPQWYVKEVVTLEGLFVHPGKYALLYPGEKLASVLSRSGGFKEGAYVQGGRFFRTKDSVGRVGVDIHKATSGTGSKANIPLVGGDSIYIPERLNTVKVVGEVGFETSVLFSDGSSVQYYIEKAGGFTRRSEKDKVVVQYANGETSRDGYFNRKPDAGSVIFVPQGPEPIPINWFNGLNTLLGTMGVAAAVILSIQAIQK
jgi:polysaccharide export outer membrane protein